MDHETWASESSAGERLEVVHHEPERFYELTVNGEFGGLLVYGLATRRDHQDRSPGALRPTR
jgi:hypothetical protein